MAPAKHKNVITAYSRSFFIKVTPVSSSYIAGRRFGKYVTIIKTIRENKTETDRKNLRSTLDFLFILIKLTDVMPIAPMSLAIIQNVVALFEVLFAMKKAGMPLKLKV
jgi:hypothetical protein